jgi:hypothetical protein
MRAFASYVMAGTLLVLAMDFVAPHAGLGLPGSAWPVVDPRPVVDPSEVARSVIRTHKADRLITKTSTDKSQTPQKKPAVLVGCDPVFSPLSTSAKANFPGRCIA